MQKVFIGQTKVIVHGGRYFRHCEGSEELVSDAEWAAKVLKAPDVIYPNGRSSHVVAGEVLDRAEDGLLEFMVLVA